MNNELFARSRYNDHTMHSGAQAVTGSAFHSVKEKRCVCVLGSEIAVVVLTSHVVHVEQPQTGEEGQLWAERLCHVPTLCCWYAASTGLCVFPLVSSPHPSALATTGRVCTSHMLECLVGAAYHKPFIIRVVELMLLGPYEPNHSSPHARGYDTRRSSVAGIMPSTTSTSVSSAPGSPKTPFADTPKPRVSRRYQLSGCCCCLSVVSRHTADHGFSLLVLQLPAHHPCARRRHRL